MTRTTVRVSSETYKSNAPRCLSDELAHCGVEYSRAVSKTCHKFNLTTPGVVVAVLAVVLAVLAGMFLSGRSGKDAWALKDSTVSQHLRQFVAKKQAEALAAARSQGDPMPPEYQKFFAAAARGNWRAASNIVNDPNTDGMHGFVSNPGNAPALETYYLLEAFALGEENHVIAFGKDIIESIPQGSVFFVGTYPTRSVIAGMYQSDVNADSIFTLAHHSLGRDYLADARSMYDGSIYLPTAAETEKYIKDYLDEVQRRVNAGERWYMIEERAQVKGEVTPMSLQGRLAKLILDNNPDREFYLE